MQEKIQGAYIGDDTFGSRDGGWSSLGSKAVDPVDGILVLVDVIATGTQIANDIKRKAANNETFIFFFPCLCWEMIKGGGDFRQMKESRFDERLDIEDEIYTEKTELSERELIPDERLSIEDKTFIEKADLGLWCNFKSKPTEVFNFMERLLIRPSLEVKHRPAPTNPVRGLRRRKNNEFMLLSFRPDQNATIWMEPISNADSKKYHTGVSGTCTTN